VDACCAQDAEVKAVGQDGCGCGSEPMADVAMATAAGGSSPAGKVTTRGGPQRMPQLVPIGAHRKDRRTNACCG
jgi:hypothetical protein